MCPKFNRRVKLYWRDLQLHRTRVQKHWPQHMVPRLATRWRHHSTTWLHKGTGSAIAPVNLNLRLRLIEEQLLFYWNICVCLCVAEEADSYAFIIICWQVSFCLGATAADFEQWTIWITKLQQVYMRSEVFTLVKSHVVMFWLMTPYNLARGYQRLVGIFCPEDRGNLLVPRFYFSITSYALRPCSILASKSNHTSYNVPTDMPLMTRLLLCIVAEKSPVGTHVPDCTV
jgi:hypothetical protein